MSHLSTKAVDLLYENNLLIITIKAKSVIDQADVLEFVEGAKQLVRRETFATLIDGREEHFMMQSAQELLSNQACGGVFSSDIRKLIAQTLSKQ